MTFNQERDGQAMAVQSAERGIQGYDPPVSRVRPLSRYRPPRNGVLAPDIASIESLATVSAGRKSPDGKIERSTDGTIFVADPHDRALGLREYLAGRDYKSMVIGFAWNDTARFVKQRMAKHRAGGLEITGDEHGLAQWVGKVRKQLDPDTPAFDAAWAMCQAETWLYFNIGGFDEDGIPMLNFVDNTPIPYRMQFTSANSRRNLDSCLDYLKALGQIAMMPVLAQIIPDYPVILPTGERQKAPVWTFTPLLGPEGSRDAKLRFDQRRFLALRQQAREISAAIGALPSPDDALVHQAMLTEGSAFEDEGTAEPTPEQIALLARGGACNADYWRGRFHGTVQGTTWETPSGRAKWFSWYTKRFPEPIVTSSLREFLAASSESDAAKMLDVLLEYKERLSSGAVDPGTGEVKAVPVAPPTITEQASSPEILYVDEPDYVDGEFTSADDRILDQTCNKCGLLSPELASKDGRFECADLDECRERVRLGELAEVEDDAPATSEQPALSGGQQLTAVLTPGVGGGETFDCTTCRTPVASVKIKDSVLPARQWLTFISEQGIDAPLCHKCAQQVMRDRKAGKKPERVVEQSPGLAF